MYAAHEKQQLEAWDSKPWCLSKSWQSTWQEWWRVTIPVDELDLNLVHTTNDEDNGDDVDNVEDVDDDDDNDAFTPRIKKNYQNYLIMY